MKKYIKKYKKRLIIGGVSAVSLAIVVGAFLINPYAPLLGGLGGLMYMLLNIKIKG